MALTQITTKGIKDGTITGTDLATNIDLVDSQKLRLGTGNDLQIYHNGSNSYIEETGTGILGIQSSEVQIGNASSNKVGAKFFQNAQVELYYDNSKKFETTSAGVTVTGALAATSLSATGGITGTGGNFILGDSSGTSDDRIKLGASQDLQIYHDGTNSHLYNATGEFRVRGNDLRLMNAAGNEHYLIGSANGAVSLYYDNEKRFETLASGAKFSECNYIDLLAKEGQEAAIYVFADQGDDNADKWRIRANTSGNYYLENKASGSWETNYKAIGNGAVELYYDNSRKFRTYSSGVKIASDSSSGRLVFEDTDGNFCWQLTGFDAVSSGSGGRGAFQDANGAIVLDMRASGGNIFSYNTIKLNGGGSVDNLKLILGASDDLQIYHDGTNSHVQNGTGTLRIRGDSIKLNNNAASENYLVATANGAVELYYDNSKKLETTSTGVSVTGKLSIVETTSTNSAHIKMGTSTNQNVHLELENDGSADIRFGCFGSGASTWGNITANDGFIHTTNDLCINATSDTGNISIGTGATPSTKLFVKSDGSIGIGTTSPSKKLEVNTGTASDGIKVLSDEISATLGVNNTGDSYARTATLSVSRTDSGSLPFLLLAGQGGIQFASDINNERMRIDSSGSVRIAHDSFTADTSADDLIVGSTTSGINRGITILNHTGQDGRLCFAQSGDPDAGMIKYSHGSDVMQFFVESDEKMRIASDGNVGIGKSSSSLDVDGSIFIGSGQGMNMVKSGSGGKIITLNRRTNVGLSIEFYRGSSVGSISHNNTSTAYNTTSDYRLKENVVSLSDAITRLKTLKPYRFNFIADKDTTVDGFLAHEVTAVPEAIQGEKDAVITQEMIDNEDYEKERLGEILPQGIDQAKLVPLLVAAVQEAIGKIEVLETEVAVLKAS